MAEVYVKASSAELCSRMLHFIVATAGMLAVGWIVYRLIQRQEGPPADDRPDGPGHDR